MICALKRKMLWDEEKWIISKESCSIYMASVDRRQDNGQKEYKLFDAILPLRVNYDGLHAINWFHRYYIYISVAVANLSHQLDENDQVNHKINTSVMIVWRRWTMNIKYGIFLGCPKSSSLLTRISTENEQRVWQLWRLWRFSAFCENISLAAKKMWIFLGFWKMKEKNCIKSKWSRWWWVCVGNKWLDGGRILFVDAAAAIHPIHQCFAYVMVY